MGQNTKKKILVVDDEKDLVDALEKFLSNAGYEVLKANTGKDAIKIAKDQHPNLILLDIKMPETDGDKITDILRSDLSTSKIPIIYQTALVKKEDVEDGHVTGSKIGNTCFIAKPYDPEELLKMIHKNIE